MNPVLILTRNNLDLTKRCVDSVRAQDITPTPTILIIDNGSTDGTTDWLPTDTDSTAGILGLRWPDNRGVSAGWNWGLDYWFNTMGAGHVLVLNNDAILPSWYYRELLEYAYPFVTGVAVDKMPKECPPWSRPTPHPDFSSFLIHREAWEIIGRFDESMKLYAGDTDYHVRGHKLGVSMMKVNQPYYHINSQTLKRADPADREAIQAQANKDREVFRQKWGCLPGTPKYEALFK